MKLKMFYLGTSENKWEFDGKKGTSIKVKTASLDGSGNTFVWKVKEENHNLQNKLSKVPPMTMVELTVDMIPVKEVAVLVLQDIAPTK